MDGRDIGTVVLPDADLKIYLTASAEERARRRCLELSERGTPKAYEEVLREINERDYQDMHRDIARCARQRMPCTSTRRSSTLKRASGRC